MSGWSPLPLACVACCDDVDESSMLVCPDCGGICCSIECLESHDCDEGDYDEEYEFDGENE